MGGWVDVEICHGQKRGWMDWMLLLCAKRVMVQKPDGWCYRGLFCYEEDCTVKPRHDNVAKTGT